MDDPISSSAWSTGPKNCSFVGSFGELSFKSAISPTIVNQGVGLSGVPMRIRLPMG